MGNIGAVGSCVLEQCSPERGPTHCHLGGCFCNEGYCRYPASTLHVQSRYCVARVPHATCHLTRFCWNGGLSESFCEAGDCMCKWGFHPVEESNGKYTCEAASATELTAAVAANATQEEIEALMEHKDHSDKMAAQNLAIATAWLCGGASLVVTGAALLLRRRYSKVHAQTAGYQVLIE